MNSRTVSYTCPYCGKNYEIDIYDSVIADEDADLRDRCLSGDLFRSTCPRCKRDFMVQYPLVYIDRSHRFVIWLNETAPSETLMRSIAGPLIPQGYTLRRTPTLKEFAEKNGMVVVILSKKNRKKQRVYDEDLYKLRHLVDQGVIIVDKNGRRQK